MAQAQFPQIPDLQLPVHERIGVPNENVNMGKYTVSNPHPDFGKDPNIKNEYGHTVYPKMIYKADGSAVVVNNEAEEARYYEPKEEKEVEVETKNKW